MATKTWKIEKDLCRCCHAEGAFDNLSEPRIFLEKEEVYSDMLRECLDIDIPAVPGELSASTYTICNTCIGRLRDACNFKKQVQDCEQRFMTLYYKNAIQGLKPETKVKEELEVTVEDSHSDMEAGIVLKKEDTDDDDHLSGGGDDDDMSEDDLPIKRALSIAKTRPKPKPKPKAPPVKKEKPPPKPKKKAEEPKPAKEKKGAKQLVELGTDYRKDGDRFVCVHCDKSYNIKNSIYYHIRSIHFKSLGKRKPSVKREGVKPGTVVCGKDYIRIDGDKFRCVHCDKVCNKLSTLQQHVRADHFGIVKFTCPVCDAGFRYEAQLTIHKLKEHDLDHRYDCKACDGKFYTRRASREHVQVFHMQGEKRKCPLCDYECYKMNAIRRHMYKHNRQKNKKCQYCNKAFARLSTLRQHERIHKGDKRSVCKVCDEAFVQKASLNYHMTKYHPSVNF